MNRAEQLIEIRNELDVSGEEFAELLGVSFRTLKKWEDGEKEVPRLAVTGARLILDQYNEDRKSYAKERKS